MAYVCRGMRSVWSAKEEEAHFEKGRAIALLWRSGLEYFDDLWEMAPDRLTYETVDGGGKNKTIVQAGVKNDWITLLAKTDI